MIKRVNFTGRRRIPRSRADIEVVDGTPRVFHATIDLADMAFPPDAAVVVEATCAGSSVVERFEFGTIKAIHPPRDRHSPDLVGENVYFTLKVIDRRESVGRLLGIAEHIRPQRAGKQTAAGRQGILPVDVREMGQELWQLDTSGPSVVLFVNKDLPELKDRARTDAYFYALVYPEVVRRLLAQAIADGGSVDHEDDDRWQTLWLRFGQNLHSSHEAPPRERDAADGEIDDWINDAVQSFCESHTMKEKFVAELGRRAESDT